MRLLLIIFFGFVSFAGHCQLYDFTVFSQEAGIQEPYVYDIAQHDNGKLYLATSGGVFIYNGHEFTKIDGLASDFITQIEMLRDGQVLLADNSGGISLLENEEPVKMAIKDSIRSPIVAMAQEDGRVIALSKTGELISIIDQQAELLFKIPENQIFNTVCYRKNEVIIGSSQGLMLFNIKSKRLVEKNSLAMFQNKNVKHIICDEEEVLIATENHGVWQMIGYNVKQVIQPSSLTQNPANHLFKDQFGDLWVSTFGNGVYQFTINKYQQKIIKHIYNVASGLPGDNVVCSFTDREGITWVGTYGFGLAKLNNDYFIHHELSANDNGTVYSVFQDREHLYGLYGQVIIKNYATDTRKNYDHDNHKVPLDKVTAVCRDSLDNVWIGTKSEGLFYMTGQDTVFKVFPLNQSRLSKKINHLLCFEQEILVSTADGIFRINPSTKKVIHHTTMDGLPHNNIHSTFLSSEGDIYVMSSTSQITFVRNGEIVALQYPDSFGPIDIFAMTEDDQGRLWFATHGQGVMLYDQGGFKLINEQLGLKSDYCYSIESDDQGLIWISHKGGLSSFNPKTGEVLVYDYKNNVAHDFSRNASFKDDQGNLWFGHDKGVLQYDFSQNNEIDFIPHLQPVSVEINDNQLSILTHYSTPYHESKFTAVFSALSLKRPEDIEYQFKLQGYDNEWSEASPSGIVKYNHIPDGDYTLLVRTRLKGNSWSEPYEFAHLTIEKPYWKTWWFWTLISGGMIAMVYILLRIRTERLKQTKIELQKMLAERTEELVKKTNILSRQHSDIQDSINYAERIQRASLPDISMMKDNFPESFIFFQPRDKVSGDFYWFDKFGEKFVVAAADATGHGVPGAFMSMVGSTMIKELAQKKHITAPSTLMRELDFKVNTVLSQYNKPGDGKDGMDMAVAEIDLQSNVLRVASALRPVWLIRNKKFVKIRSSRSTVGGGMSQSSDGKKVFPLHEHALQKGDIIYLFSDGYADQFGGPKGKKMKIRRFRELIQRIQYFPMEDQKNTIEDYFNTWKGEEEQIDDVLVIGIKI